MFLKVYFVLLCCFSLLVFACSSCLGLFISASVSDRIYLLRIASTIGVSLLWQPTSKCTPYLAITSVLVIAVSSTCFPPLSAMTDVRSFSFSAWLARATHGPITQLSANRPSDFYNIDNNMPIWHPQGKSKNICRCLQHHSIKSCVLQYFVACLPLYFWYSVIYSLVQYCSLLF